MWVEHVKQSVVKTQIENINFSVKHAEPYIIHGVRIQDTDFFKRYIYVRLVFRYLRHVDFNFINVLGSAEGGEKKLIYLLVFFSLLCGK
jgi:hypothetical protein